MKVVPYAIIGAVVVALAVRRGRGRARGRPPVRSVTGCPGRWRVPFGDTGLVAAREVRERVRGRLFKGVTVLLLAVVAAAIVIPTIHSSSSKPQRVGVVGSIPTTSRREIMAAAKKVDVTLRLSHEPSLAAARAALRGGRLDMVVDDHRAIVVATPVAPSDSTATSLAARAVASTLGVDHALRSAHLSPAQAAALAGATPLPLHSMVPAGNGATRSTSVIGLVLVFIMLTQYLAWTLMGVMEEKSSRVVEVLLAAVRPRQLLGGKVLGIGLVAMAQAVLVVAFALVVARAVGSDLLNGTAPLVLVATLAWLVLGYGFYCWVYAAAGSLAERQDQVQSLALPLSVPLIVGYVVALTSAASQNPSLFVKVLAYLPPTAPFAMPVLVAAGKVSWWEFFLSVLCSLACTVVVARLAATVYRRAVLRTGGRIRLRELRASHG